MIGIVIILATVDVGYLIMEDIFAPPFLILKVDKLLELFGMLLLVLIGLELMETIYLFHKDRIVSAEIILIVALVAMARKVIILDQSKLSSLTFFDIGILMLSLAGAYFVLNLRQKNIPDPSDKKSELPNETKFK
jgi:uncharacterized membrane protein (DUF373 family)